MRRREFITLLAGAVFGKPLAASARDADKLPHVGFLAVRSNHPALPAFMFVYREGVDAGGLLSYGPYLPDLWRRSAMYGDRILRGADVAALPIEQPTKFELAINLTTAKSLALDIPPRLLAVADEVIE